ncbi:hypothetical protein BD770DRAFT_377507 [Pilaira anomala]|nr:hypothetical protein BD770DRAFT_377507 [Pilaira anomala]
MVLRSCLYYKKCPTFSTKRTITQARNMFAVKPKYPGVSFQPCLPQRLAMSTVTSVNHIEKIEIPTVTKPVVTLPVDKLDQVLHKQLTPKQTVAFYRELSKRDATEIYNLLLPKLETIDYTQLRHILIDAAKYWTVEKILTLMSLCNGKYVPWRLDLLQSLQSSYVLSKNIDHLLRALPESGPNCDILPFYNSVLNRCLKQNQYDHLLQVMEMMKQRDIDPDTATNNILTRMQLKNCTTAEESFKLYKDIISNGVKPNPVTFNTFLKYACKHKQWDMLSTWLDTMKEDGVEPNHITVRILFKAYVDNPTDTNVEEAFERVSKSTPINGKEKLLNTGITKLLETKQTKAAMNLLDKTFESNEPLSLYSYNLLLQALCLDGKVELAQQVLDSMVTRDNNNIPQPDIVSFTTLIHGLIRNSTNTDIEQVSIVYKQCLDQGLQSNNVLQSVMLYGLIRSNQNMEVTKIKSMFELIMKNKNVQRLPRLSTDKELDEMIIYNMMMDFYFLHYHHSITLRDQIPKEPFALLQDAVEHKKLKPTVSTLNILVRGLAILNKDLIGAEKMVSLLKGKGVKIDERTVWYLSKSAYNQGQITKARQWIDLFESEHKPIEGSGLIDLKSILTKWDKKEEE